MTIRDHNVTVENVWTPSAANFFDSFTEHATLKYSWETSKQVRECYNWCEKHLGVKNQDWYMMDKTIHFKNSKGATMFKLMWADLIEESKST